VMNVHFFASVREAMGRETLQLSPPGDVASVRDLARHLADTHPAFQQLSAGAVPLLVAVNQTVVDWDAPIQEGDEIAFFPPMTGG